MEGGDVEDKREELRMMEEGGGMEIEFLKYGKVKLY